MKTNWSVQFTKLLAKFSPKTNLAEFRNEYSEVLKGVDGNDLPSKRELLNTVRPAIEKWVTDDGYCPCCAEREWVEFYEKAGKSLPTDVLVGIAKKLPVIGSKRKDWKSFFYSCSQKNLLAAVVDRRVVSRTSLIIGSGEPLEKVSRAIDDFAGQIVKACTNFCSRHKAMPQQMILTGGGAFIRQLRESVTSRVQSQLETPVYDLLDEDEPLRVLLEKRTPEGWRHDQSEVDARRRENIRLVRGGSAIGGCSVFVDLPEGLDRPNPPRQKSSKRNPCTT